MAIVVAAKKTASVIALMMIALLALFVSRPAIFDFLCGQLRTISSSL
jgi:hypothetical protein